MNEIFKHLTEPEYMHVLINPMPVYGLSMGVAAMIVALIYRKPPVITGARAARIQPDAIRGQPAPTRSEPQTVGSDGCCQDPKSFTFSATDSVSAR